MKTMKTMKLLFILCITGMCFPSLARAQENYLKFAYVTLKSCENDTLLYLEKNHGVQARRYYDTTFHVFLDDARDDCPFKSYWTDVLNDGTIVKFVFFFEPVEKVKEKVKKKLPLLAVNILPRNYLYLGHATEKTIATYHAIEARGLRRIIEFDDAFYDIVKDLTIEYTYKATTTR